MIDILFAFSLMASAITANKIILKNFDPTSLVAIRMLCSGLILFIFTFFNDKHKLNWHKVKSNINLLLLISISTTLVPSILKAYALLHMASYKAAFFGTLDPFVTSIYAYFLFDEKLNWQKFLGIILGCLGTFVLIYSTIPSESFNVSAIAISLPELAAIVAVFISRWGWIQAQKLLKQNIYSPAQINTLMMLISGILASILVAFNWQKVAIISIDLQTQIALFYTIIIGNLISYNLYAKVLKEQRATFVSLVGFSIPLFVSFYGFILLKEQLSMYFFISLLITFIGFWIFSRAEKKGY